MNYEALDESLEYLDVISEGANAELWKESAKVRKEFTASIKAAKAKIKEKKFKDAKKDIAAARKTLNEYSKYIDTFQSDGAISVITGYWMGCLNAIGRQGLSLVLAIIGTFAGSAIASAVTKDMEKAANMAKLISLPMTLWNTIKAWYLAIMDIISFVDSISKHDDAADILNYYRTQCKTAIKDYEYQLKSIENKLDKLEQYDKEKK